MSDLLSAMLKEHIDFLDEDKDDEGDEKEKRTAEKLLRLTVSSLEGFSPQEVERVLSIFKEDAELWHWAVDNFYTREVVEGVHGMVNRFLRLTPVLAGVIPSSEVNVYLRESSRCFIYGFFQASIALSRAALESGLNDHLAKKLGKLPEVELAQKINQAARLKLVSAAGARHANNVRIAARDVLHRKPAKENTAFDVLVQSRGFLGELYER